MCKTYSLSKTSSDNLSSTQQPKVKMLLSVILVLVSTQTGLSMMELEGFTKILQVLYVC